MIIIMIMIIIEFSVLFSVFRNSSLHLYPRLRIREGRDYMHSMFSSVSFGQYFSRYIESTLIYL